MGAAVLVLGVLSLEPGGIGGLRLFDFDEGRLKGALIEERAFVEERFRWVERGEEKGKVVLREEVGVRVWEG